MMDWPKQPFLPQEQHRTVHLCAATLQTPSTGRLFQASCDQAALLAEELEAVLLAPPEKVSNHINHKCGSKLADGVEYRVALPATNPNTKYTKEPNSPLTLQIVPVKPMYNPLDKYCDTSFSVPVKQWITAGGSGGSAFLNSSRMLHKSAWASRS